jgi:hypothetical protein
MQMRIKKETPSSTEIIRMKDEKIGVDMSMTMKLGVANLELKVKEHNQTKQDSKLVAINCAIRFLHEKFNRAEQRAQRYCPNYDDTNPL